MPTEKIQIERKSIMEIINMIETPISLNHDHVSFNAKIIVLGLTGALWHSAPELAKELGLKIGISTTDIEEVARTTLNTEFH